LVSWRARSVITGVRFGVLLDRSHRPQVLLVELGGDHRSERAEGNRHAEVQDQPPVDRGARLFLLEGVVDVYIHCGPQRADPDRVVEIDRSRALETGDGAPPVLARLVRLAIVVAASELDGIRLDVGGAANWLDGGSQRS
jgi:hypothetical protein